MMIYVQRYRDSRIPFESTFPVWELTLRSDENAKESPLGHFTSEIPSPPEKIWIQGREDALSILAHAQQVGLAIVGTRAPQERVLQLIQNTLGELRASQLIIVSGFARGVDAAAHTGALQVGLKTIAILGTALHRRYPVSHHDFLRKQILESGGLILSEVNQDAPQMEFQFLRRNRLIAAFTRATWIGQAAERSGALNTAEWAGRLGRPLFVTPCFPGDPFLAGNQRLLSETHARPIFSASCLSSVWLELLSPSPVKPRLEKRKKNPPPLNQKNNLSLQLEGFIREETMKQGGVDLFALQSVFCTGAVAYPDFFKCLQSLLSEGIIKEKGGFLHYHE